MNVFTVDLKNQPGELAHLGEALGQRGINLQLSGVTAGDHGLVYFTASDEDAARTAAWACQPTTCSPRTRRASSRLSTLTA